ncbi:MAG TPA: hypothetical protein VKZ61_05920 [Thermomicrobiales bacterium]|jgi:hypothetical protein|nr:hypothetical protein [Thermomicrobiales bacterium]
MHEYALQAVHMLRAIQSMNAQRPPRVVVEDSIFRLRQRPRYRIGEWLVRLGNRLTGVPTTATA